MSDLATPELRNLRYRIELNACGKLEMRPPSNRHGRLQAVLALELGRQLQGMVLTQCSILTRIGVRAPDVAWASPEFMKAFGEITPYTRAPEICVEILSSSDVQAEVIEKTGAYLAAGADEVWWVSEDGTARYATLSGELAKSRFPVTLSLPPPLQASP
jgi:Uma2 family endonuclease